MENNAALSPTLSHTVVKHAA